MHQMNLARKWRSKHFDELVGQQLVVRLVKNSLYRNLIFPVYLLAGTRGCGKTSLARIFAAALNCQALEQFQKNPQQQLPCLTCESCSAMQGMNHPDFIEIDAASHTGVDNVRQIIDAAAFVPILGTKKIYLIDEAHMLSKAAFNALLKILEEPPQSVVFMLATTDPHKILETVTSRCFQLFFEPIAQSAVVQHVAAICKQEGLETETAALELIAHETGGSMRDALNLLERLRIAYPVITKAAVIELLGTVDEERLLELFKTAVDGSPEEMLTVCTRLELHTYNAFVVWKKLVELIRISLWIKHGVMPVQASPVHGMLKECVVGCSYERLIALFELCYSYELSFAKTSAPSSMLEMMLLKMCITGHEKQERAGTPHNSSSARYVAQPQGAALPQRASLQQTSHKNEDRDVKQGTTETKGTAKAEKAASLMPQDAYTAQATKLITPSQAVTETIPQTPKFEEKEATQWTRCLKELESMSDPLIVSIFKQVTCELFDAEKRTLKLVFSKDLEFFKDWLETSKKTWKPIIENHYGAGILLSSDFTGASTKERPLKMGAIAPTRSQTDLGTNQAAQISSGASAASVQNQTAAAKNSPAPTKASTVQQKYPTKTFYRQVPKVQEEPAGAAFIPHETTDPISAMALKLFPGTMSAIALEENQ